MSIRGYVGVHTTLTLGELAAMLSEHFCGGIPFHREDGVRDEIPGMSLKSPFLGIGIVVYGEAGEFGIDVECWDDSLDELFSGFDISQYLVELLSRLAGVDVFARKV